MKNFKGRLYLASILITLCLLPLLLKGCMGQERENVAIPEGSATRSASLVLILPSEVAKNSSSTDSFNQFNTDRIDSLVVTATPVGGGGMPITLTCDQINCNTTPLVGDLSLIVPPFVYNIDVVLVLKTGRRFTGSGTIDLTTEIPEVRITLTVDESPIGPVRVDVHPLVINAGESAVVSCSNVVDPDDDPLTAFFDAQGGFLSDTSIAFNQSAEVTWSFSQTESGFFNITCTVSDPTGGSVSGSGTIQVIPPTPTPPPITPPTPTPPPMPIPIPTLPPPPPPPTPPALLQ